MNRAPGREGGGSRPNTSATHLNRLITYAPGTWLCSPVPFSGYGSRRSAAPEILEQRHKMIAQRAIIGP
jgi:hypothetical protein